MAADKDKIKLTPLAFAKLVGRNEGHIRRLIRSGDLPKELTYGVAVEYNSRPKKTPSGKVAGAKKYEVWLTPTQAADFKNQGIKIVDPGVSAKARRQEKSTAAEAWLKSHNLSL